MIEFFIKGGLLMYPILLCSIIALTIFLYKFFEFKKFFNGLTNKNLTNNEILKEFIDLFKNENSDEEINILWIKKVHFLEKGLSSMSLLANVSTLLGLTGTVTGMIKTFMTISQIQTPNPNLLSKGIWEALITTAFGLFVAIPVYIGLHYLEKKEDEIVILFKENILKLKKIC